VLSQTQAGKVLGFPVGSPVASVTGSAAACAYRPGPGAPSSAREVTIEILSTPLAQVQRHIVNPSPLPGIGHQAVCGSSSSTPGVTLYAELDASHALMVSGPSCLVTEELAVGAYAYVRGGGVGRPGI
jgi:hypothetical protein